jgi:membrane-associated phospholipid phosphatase
MPIVFRLSAFGVVALALVACAPQPVTVTPIYVEPVYNKYGAMTGGSCPSGLVATAGTAGGREICVPRGGGCPTGHSASSAAGGTVCVPDDQRGRDSRPGRQ